MCGVRADDLICPIDAGCNEQVAHADCSSGVLADAGAQRSQRSSLCAPAGAMDRGRTRRACRS